MPKGIGHRGIVGIRRNTNPWGGAALAVGAGHGVWANAVNLSASMEGVESNEIQGRSTSPEDDNGNLVVGGPVEFPLWFEGLEFVIALIFGTAGVPATVDVSARAHTFKINDVLDALLATLAFENVKDTKVYEYDCLKWNRLTVRAQQGRVILEVDGIGFGFTDASAINTTTTIDTVTHPTNREAANFRQIVVRQNAQGGGALAAGDALHVSGFELTIERGLERDFTTEFGGAAGKTSEPVAASGEAGKTRVSGSFAFSNLTSGGTGQNAQLVAEQIAGTLKKADIVITGDTLAGAATEKYSHKLFLPKIKFGAAQKPGISGLGRLGWTVPFKCHHVAVAPTGFTAGHVDAVTWVATSKITADALA